MSGPARGRLRQVQRPVVSPQGAVALPQPLAPRLVDAVVRLPDSRWLDRLLRGRAWIALIAVALIGLVFLQVSMLSMNAGIGQKVERADALERQNADLSDAVSQLSSEERIQRVAQQFGLIMPSAGDVQYLRAGGGEKDAAKAVRIMHAPDPQAVQQSAAATAAATAQTATPPPTEASAQAQHQTNAAAGTVPGAATTSATPQPQATAQPSQSSTQTQAPTPATAQTQAAAPQQQAQATPSPMATGAVAAPGTGR